MSTSGEDFKANSIDFMGREKTHTKTGYCSHFCEERPGEWERY